jgi:hypothetical protein
MDHIYEQKRLEQQWACGPVELGRPDLERSSCTKALYDWIGDEENCPCGHGRFTL